MRGKDFHARASMEGRVDQDRDSVQEVRLRCDIARTEVASKDTSSKRLENMTWLT